MERCAYTPPVKGPFDASALMGMRPVRVVGLVGVAVGVVDGM